MLRKRFRAVVKFFCVSRIPSHYWAVLKNRYFRPWFDYLTLCMLERVEHRLRLYHMQLMKVQ